MKRFIKWLAKVFKVDITTVKIKEVVKEKIIEKPVEVIKEIEKPIEVIKEVTIYKDTKYIAIKDKVTGDVFIEGNLIVEGSLIVDGEVTCHSIKQI